MTCKVCNEDYSDFDGYLIKGECLPCRSQRIYEEDCEKEKKEIVRYNKKYGTNYDDNSFYYACDSGSVELSTLKGFPRMKSIMKYSDMIKAEIEYHDKMQNEKQLDLFGDPSDLPF